MGYAGWMPSRIGQPWEDWEDVNIQGDLKHGCALWVIAQRARRTEAEVAQRLAELASMKKPPGA